MAVRHSSLLFTLDVVHTEDPDIFILMNLFGLETPYKYFNYTLIQRPLLNTLIEHSLYNKTL